MVLVATQVKRRRGTTAENDAFTGAEGEITVDTERHELRVHDGVTQGGFRIYTQAEVDSIISQQQNLPAGVIVPFAGTNIPTGFLLCDGSAISRTDYADLFDAIGTIYGAGDGSTTFNLPNCINHIPWMGGTGSAVGDFGNGFLPNIRGTVGTHNHSLSNLDGVLFKGGQYGGSQGLSGAGSFPNIAFFDASKYNSIYSDSATIVVPAYTIVGGYIIKY